MNLSTVTPGWLAGQLTPSGSAMAMALLGVQTTLESGKAGDEDLSSWYAGLATSNDPVFTLNKHYIDLEHQYPFLVGSLAPLTRWTEEPVLAHYEELARQAQALSAVAWSDTEGICMEDVLGQVYNQMISIGAGRTQVFHYATIEDAFIGLLERGYGPGPQPSAFTDAWCGSGCRAIGAARVLRVFGRETSTMTWRLNDASPMAAALTGLNMVAHDIGPKVVLTASREWAEAWGTSSFYGRAPSVRRALPPEIRKLVGEEPEQSVIERLLPALEGEM